MVASLQTSSTQDTDSLQDIYNNNLVIPLDKLKIEKSLLKQIQIRLSALGLYLSKDVDGEWGELTAEALEGFCQAVHLNSYQTGMFGASFAKALIETKSVGMLPIWAGGTQNQTIRAIAAEATHQGITDRNQICYMVATVRHEAAGTYQPIAEFGRGAGMSYAPLYYGRGYVQLTWDFNYETYGKKLNIDLLGNPDLAMEPAVALFILVDGMKNGIFTGKKLSDFISGNNVEFTNARQIINGMDRANLIAGYATEFQNSPLF